MASFLNCSPYSCRSNNYRDSKSCHSFLKAIAKSKEKLSHFIARENIKNRYRDSWKIDNHGKKNLEKKQRTVPKKVAMNVKNDKFKEAIEKSPISLAHTI